MAGGWDIMFSSSTYLNSIMSLLLSCCRPCLFYLSYISLATCYHCLPVSTTTCLFLFSLPTLAFVPLPSHCLPRTHRDTFLLLLLLLCCCMERLPCLPWPTFPTHTPFYLPPPPYLLAFTALTHFTFLDREVEGSSSFFSVIHSPHL